MREADIVRRGAEESNSLRLLGALSITVYRKDGRVEERGVVCRKMVSTVFVNLLVDALQGDTAPLETFRYHDSGTGTTPPAITDTALASACGDPKDEGTQTEGDAAHVYKSVATHTYGGTFDITEHGLFNADDALMDRSTFTAIGVDIGDQIRYMYELTCVAGG